MQWFIELFEKYNEISKGNPVAGLILVPIVAAIVGSFVYYVKSVPKNIWEFIKRNTIVTLSMNNTGYDGNAIAYEMFDSWFSKSKHVKHSRNFFLLRSYVSSRENKYDVYRIGVGVGTHFFTFAGRLFWFVKTDLPSTGSERQKEQIVIRTFGTSGECFQRLTRFFNDRTVDTTKIDIFNWSSSNGWNSMSSVRYKDIDKICIDPTPLNEVITSIQNFIDGRKDYIEKGLTHKISLLFHGPAGTGKTSLTKGIAGYFRRDIYVLDMTQVSNRTLPEALQSVEPGSIVLIEDVDQAGAAVRDRTKKPAKSDGEMTLSLGDELSGLTMSGVLNALDGVVALDNIILVFTSNHPELLDPAIRRKSRIDHEILIDYMAAPQVHQYALMMYGKKAVNDPKFKELFDKGLFKLPGCDAEAAYKENASDPVGFLHDVLAASKKY